MVAKFIVKITVRLNDFIDANYLIPSELNLHKTSATFAVDKVVHLIGFIPNIQDLQQTHNENRRCARLKYGVVV